MRFTIEVADADLLRLKEFWRPVQFPIGDAESEKVSGTPTEPEVAATEAELREALINCAGRLTAAEAKTILKKVTGYETASAVPEFVYPAAIAALNEAK